MLCASETFSLFEIERNIVGNQGALKKLIELTRV